MAKKFNPAPGWPAAPEGWTPPPGWTPDPSWPAAPDGWQFWVDDAAPTSVLPAVQGTPQQGNPQQFHQPGQSEQPGQEPKKTNHLAWIIPVAVVVVIGLVFGGLAIGGVFSSDDDKPEVESSAPAETPPNEDPMPEPTTPKKPIEPTPPPGENENPPGPEVLEGLEGMEEFEKQLKELEGMLGSGEKSTDPATPAFCESFNNLEDEMSGVQSEDPTAAELAQVVQTAENITPPAEISEEWDIFTQMMRDLAVLATENGGQLTPEQLDSSMFEETNAVAFMRIGGFVSVNCDPVL